MRAHHVFCCSTRDRMNSYTLDRAQCRVVKATSRPGPVWTEGGMFRQFLSCVTSAALVMGTMPAPLGAQPAPAPSPAPVAAAEQGQAEQGQVETFSTAQLEALLAPIALYPDALLTQLLMATTNPLEIVAASRWLEQGTNKDLKGKALEDALKTQPWDPSVKSLVPFPQVLETLNQQLEWTQQLGYAMQ